MGSKAKDMELVEFIRKKQEDIKYDVSITVSELAKTFDIDGFKGVCDFFKMVYQSHEYQNGIIGIHMEINNEEAEPEDMKYFFEEGELIDPRSGDVIPKGLHESTTAFMLIVRVNNELMPKHEVSVEQLHHFKCHKCTKWWTIGDFQTLDKDEVICPHCGTKAKIKEKQD